jgi:hypothetical protein
MVALYRMNCNLSVRWLDDRFISWLGCWDFFYYIWNNCGAVSCLLSERYRVISLQWWWSLRTSHQECMELFLHSRVDCSGQHRLRVLPVKFSSKIWVNIWLALIIKYIGNQILLKDSRAYLNTSVCIWTLMKTGVMCQ